MSFNPRASDGGSHHPQPVWPTSPYQSSGYPTGWAPPPGPGWYPAATPPGVRPGGRPPSKLWYVIGAALLAAGLVILAVGALRYHQSYAKIPSPEHIFESGGSTTLHFDTGETRVVFVDNRNDDHRECKATDARGADVAVEPLEHRQRLNVWRSRFSVTAADAGNFSVSCTGGRFDRFGVGGDVTEGATPAFGLMAGGYLLALTGLIALVRLARRRYRLMQPR